MSENLDVKVRVTPPPGEENQVGFNLPVDFKPGDMDRVAVVINNSVVALQGQLATADVEKQPGELVLSEVEIQFGIDLEGESKIPIIGPLLGVGLKAGATFHVHIKLTRS
jgi:hypothetical protein